MPENRTTATKNAEPIIDNQHVKELLKIVRENEAHQMKDLMTVLYKVAAMERQLGNAMNELAAMQKQLDEARALNHPALAAMEKAVINTQNFIQDLREKLTAIKKDIVSGCKGAVSAFKEKGISALNNLAGFFGIKSALESVRNDLNRAIEHDNKAIGKIETISKNYHEAGKHLRNVGRALLGKEAIQEAKPVGAVAKSFIAPYKADRSCCEKIKKHVEAAICCNRVGAAGG